MEDETGVQTGKDSGRKKWGRDCGGGSQQNTSILEASSCKMCPMKSSACVLGHAYPVCNVCPAEIVTHAYQASKERVHCTPSGKSESYKQASLR